jgi:hypothetical protein
MVNNKNPQIANIKVAEKPKPKISNLFLLISRMTLRTTPPKVSFETSIR